MKFLKEWLYGLHLDSCSIEEYIALTKLCINQTFFAFKGKYYEQNDGLAMGNPLSPFLADLFMSHIEMHVNNSFPWMFKMWYRYVDDIVAIIKEKHLDDSVKLLNQQDSSVKFTVETQTDNCLPFLDLKLIKNGKTLEFGIHRKETHMDNYIHNNSFNPGQHKQAVLNSLTHRLINIPLNPKEYETEYNKILEIADRHGFKRSLVDVKIKKYKKQKLLRETTTLQLEKDPSKYKKITYHPVLHHKFQKIFKEFNIQLIPKNNHNIKNLLGSEIKDKIPNKEKSGIYKIGCNDCEQVYIGRTKRSLAIREKEHFRNVKYKQMEKSAVATHVWVQKHNVKDIELLKEAHYRNELAIWEKLFIHKHRNEIMNFEIPTENDLIKKFIRPIVVPSTGKQAELISRSLAEDMENAP